MSRRTTHIATLKFWLSALVEIRNPEAIDADVDTMQVSKADVVAPTKVGFQCCVTKQHQERSV
jgi:hypothetical protein